MLCVDKEDKPVAGAEVHLYQCESELDVHYRHYGPFTSDAHGKAISPEAVFSNAQGNFDRWIYARVPGRLVGVARGAKWTNRTAFNPEGKVKLFPSRTIEGHVTVPAGFDPAKVVIKVRYMNVFFGSGMLEYESFPRHDQFPGLDTALPEIFEHHPDAKGRIRFADIPVLGELTLVTSGDGLGEAQWKNDKNTFDQPIQLTIEEESFISGHVLAPDKKPAVGLKVTARLSARGRRQNWFLSSFRAVTDENGKFAIHGLPQTEFVLSIEDPKKLSVFRPRVDLFVDRQKDPALTLAMERGTLVRGRIKDAEDKPVQAAGFAAVADDHGGPVLADDSTDANGRYQFRLPSGRACLYFSGLPDGFAYPNPPIVKEIDIKSGKPDIENLDFTIRRQ
jgi:hypothetical protein